MESSRIVKRLQRNEAVPPLPNEQEVHREDYEGENDRHHHEEKNEICTRCRADSSKIDEGHGAHQNRSPDNVRNFGHQTMEREPP